MANNSLLTTIDTEHIMQAGFDCMKSKQLNKAFGKVLSRLRKSRKWSQEHLGFESELTRTYISLLERGKRSPTLDTVHKLTIALNVDLWEMIRMTQSMYESDLES